MRPVTYQHSDKPGDGPTRPWVTGELVAGLLAVLAGSWLMVARGAHPASALVAVAAYLTMAGLIRRFWPATDRRLGWANRVTLGRGLLVALLAGALVDPTFLVAQAWALATLALVVLLLDGADGWVARRTATASAFGARFDMELDAAFILVLCLALLSMDKVGAWVLAIGAMRYAFVLAGWRWSWLAAELPESRRRKAVCVWQVSALMIALLPPVAPPTAGWLAATALAGLALSFARDLAWLWCNRA